MIIHGFSELFHPSTTTSTTTTPLPTTSTQALPIKSHELGWDLAPVDLVMANSVLEPVFSADQRQVPHQYSLKTKLEIIWFTSSRRGYQLIATKQCQQ